MEDQSCYNCTSYKNGTCGIAQKNICSDYEYAPEVDNWWPYRMSGAYGPSGDTSVGRTISKKTNIKTQKIIPQKQRTNTVKKPNKKQKPKAWNPELIKTEDEFLKTLTPEPFKMVNDLLNAFFSEIPEKNTYLAYVDTFWGKDTSICYEVLAFYSNGEKIWNDYKKWTSYSKTDTNSARLKAIVQFLRQIKFSDKKVVIVCDDISYRKEIVKNLDEYNKLIEDISKTSREKNLYLELRILNTGNQKISKYIKWWIKRKK